MRKVLIPHAKIIKRVKKLALEIKKEYKNEPFLMLGVLNGSYMFASDLSKELWKHGFTNFSVDFIGVASYGKEKTSSQSPKFTKRLQVVLKDKNVLLVEDIVDTGFSIKEILKYLKSKNPKSVKICSLLSKSTRRKVTVEIDFLGFEIEDKWVEGYGMDTAEFGRGNGNIVEVIPEAFRRK